MHEFCKVDDGDCDGTTPTWHLLTTAYQDLEDDMATDSGTYDFDLKITTPLSTTVYSEQSVNVTVMAELAPTT